ncbi:hypothetical protein LPTSP4_27570 [Leptospira ryugenii]|uniref:Kelch repeat protein n=2 Tax=Leptospira ryugenii TaxID=1917863 RepID=A0A2P2E2V1_9LEPT|nr:hypothetical protein LPTSP4_27570 [Leptospira ryugenii]
MTAIDDRLIYIAGGDKADYNTMSTTEIYDTKENKSSIFVPMVEERSRHTATLLKNNEVFLAGGNIGVRERISDSWQVVNTQSGINLQKGTLNYARYRHKAQLLSNGDVLRIGGENFSDTIEDLELFNARLRTISSNGKLKESRSYHSIVYFDDNNIFIIGGINRDKNKDRYLRSIERFDKSRNESEIVANFEEPRAHVNAKKITNSEILICGGVNGNISPKKHFSDCLLFNIETKRFSHFTNLTKPRIYSTVDLTSDGQFLLCGGNSLDSLYNDCETVDLKTRTATIRFPRLF